MNRSKHVIAVLLFTCVSLHAANTRHAAIGFRTDPATTLPGLPVTFLVTLPDEIIKDTDDPVEARLHVTSVDTGETFVAHFAGEPTEQGRLQVVMWVSRPQGMIEIQEPINPPYGPGWFGDERLQKPGTYRLQLQVLASDRGPRQDLWSSPATLVVRQPAGVDAEAWTWLQSLPEQWNWKERGRPDLAQELIEKYPDSEYARYAIAALDGYRGDFEGWLPKALELSKGTWLEEYYLIRMHGYRAGHGSPCMAQAFPGTAAERRACMIREANEASEKFEAIGARSSSIMTKHTVEIARRRFKDQIESLKSVRDK